MQEVDVEETHAVFTCVWPARIAHRACHCSQVLVVGGGGDNQCDRHFIVMTLHCLQ